MAKVVYLMRHGQAVHNLVDHGPGSYERRRDPAYVDPSLTEQGIAEVQGAREQLGEASWRLKTS